MDVIYYGIGAELAGAFENVNRGAERYAVARSNTTDDANADTRGNLGLVQEEKC